MLEHERKMKNAEIWLVLNRTIDIVQEAMIKNTSGVDYHKIPSVDFDVSWKWLNRMQAIRWNFRI